MAPPSTYIQIVDPRGQTDIPKARPTDRPKTLAGKTVGIIMDGPWRSWYLFSEQLEAHLNDLGDVKTKRLSIGNRMATEGLDLYGVDHLNVHSEDRRDDLPVLDAFAESVDMAVVGLGN